MALLFAIARLYCARHHELHALGLHLLWQHKAGAVIGRVEHLSEDRRGLRVIASVGDARAARLLGGGKVDGLSFGYRVREAKSAEGLRELVELELVEVSLVANPMQPRARVHAVEVG